MRRITFALLLLLVIFRQQGFAQNVFDPNDPIVYFDGNNPPPTPANTLTKWVKTNRVSFNTDRFKSYYFNNMAFRLRYPNGYDRNDKTKKYPVILFMHGGGEIDVKTSNDYQLFVGAELIQSKIDSGLFNAFLLFPQAELPDWEFYYPTINKVLDSLEKYCNTDPERLISMGVSMGGLAAVQFPSQYPKRAAVAIGSSPALIQALNDKVKDFINVPLWIGSGIYDGNPSVENVSSFVNIFKENGGSVHYNIVGTSHESWYPQWLEQPIVSLWNQAYKSNPLVFYGRDQFPKGATVEARLGVTPGFYAYEWQKDNVIIPGANSNEYIATSLGVYSARFKRTESSNWSDWSHVPANIHNSDDDVTPPSAPANLHTGTITTTSIELDWDNSTDDKGLASYDIYENDVKTYSTPASTLVISNLKPGTNYKYGVVARDLAGNSSQMSNVITVKTKTPEATTGLKYRYYEGVWNELPDFAQLYPVKTGYTANVDISPRVADTYYSFVWEGNIRIPVTGDYTFEIVSDDGSKMYFNGHYVSSDRALVTNDNVHNGPQSVSAEKYIEAGTYPVAFTFFTKEAKGTMEVYWSGPGISRQIIPAYAFTPGDAAKGTSIGLNYKYFEGDWNVVPDFNALTPVKKGNSKNFDLGVRNSDDYFGFLWEGNIAIPYAGDWTFEIASDDGAKFYFNSPYAPAAAPLLANDGLHPDFPSVSNTVKGLNAGVYPMALAFFEKLGAENMRLYWTGPNTPRELVPDAAFGFDAVAATTAGSNSGSVSAAVDLPGIIATNKISGAYPNPFNDRFTIEYTAPLKSSKVEIAVYDLNGKLVATRNFGSLPAGKSLLNMNVNGKNIPKGIYIARVSVDGVPAKTIRLVKTLK